MTSDCHHATRTRHGRTARFLAVLATCLPLAAGAAGVVVRITGLSEPLGQVGCSLFAGPAGFPMDSGNARVVWLPAEAAGVVCRYADVPEGRYAIAIAHDLNGNRRVDTNLIGLPTEPWGVSNNVRPNLRAPRFDEAVFTIGADAKDVVIDIKVAR